jgi:hypothetical protein
MARKLDIAKFAMPNKPQKQTTPRLIYRVGGRFASEEQFNKSRKRKKYVEIVDTSERWKVVKKITTQEYRKIPVLHERQLTPTEKKRLSYHRKATRIIEGRYFDFISSENPITFSEKAERPPDILRCVIFSGGRKRTINVKLPRGYKLQYKSKRIKQWGKDWQAQVRKWLLDYVHMANKYNTANGEPPAQVLGFRAVWDVDFGNSEKEE